MTGVALKLENFSGLIPRISPRLLPENAATLATNAKILSGELRGLRTPSVVTSFTNTTKRAYRIPGTPDLWLNYPSINVDVVRSPVINDSFDRYYVASDLGRPTYNTRARIAAGNPFFYLGVPPPAATPGLTVPGGGDPQFRAYVYTLVSAYGEEGSPSQPVTGTGDNNGTWTVTGMSTTVSDSSFRNITHKNIYRTVPGNATSLFFFVAQVTLATASYADSSTDNVVALNPVLESTSFQEPPSDMVGFIVMPNGYLAGWVGKRLLFSEPYRPHAWPPEYELATEYNIVGLGEFNGTLVIGTESNPYIGQGVVPSSFTMQKTDSIEPCLSRRGIVSGTTGVMYPSPNGIMMINSAEITVGTQSILTRDEWQGRYNPKGIIATQFGTQYIGFFEASKALIFNPSEPNQRWVETDQFQNVDGVETDRYTGDVYLLSQKQVLKWDAPNGLSVYWTWRSKEFHFPKPVNFGAVKIKWLPGMVDVSTTVDDVLTPYNNARFAADTLNTLNGAAINGVQGKGKVVGNLLPENRAPINGSLLYQISPSVGPGEQLLGVFFRMYANGAIVFETVVLDELMVRPPAGFKADVWQFELSSNSSVFSVQIAENGRDLEKV